MANVGKDTHLFDLHVGDKVRTLRKKHNMNLSDLAEKIGLSLQHVQQYELGESRISSSTLYEISKVFSVSGGYFFEGYVESSKNAGNNILITKRQCPLNMLLVEDSFGDVLLMQEAIIQCPYPAVLHVVSDGVEALKYLRSCEKKISVQRPDIILLDLNLPKKDGITVLNDINNDRELQDIPIIIFSNSLDVDVMRDTYKKQAAGYLKKSQTLEELTEQLTTVIHYWSTMVLPSM